MHQHRGRRVVFALAVTGALLVPGLSTAASMTSAAQQTPADNTKVNKGDRAKGRATADQQKENSADREITQKIRSAIMDDKTLSTYAHNVKIVTQNGQVTLKGPVRTEDEKKDRGSQSHGSGGRWTRHQSDQHRAAQGLEASNQGDLDDQE